MIIEKVEIKNFKSVKNYTWNLSETKGFWEISGNVGSGKTALCECILYGLFGNIKGSTSREVISWGETSGYIKVWCISNNKHLYIKRDIRLYGQTMLYVEVDGEEIICNNKIDLQTKLQEEYYDVSRLLLETFCIISFNGFKNLYSLNKNDTKELLDQLFGFNILTNYVDLCKKNISKEKEGYNNITYKISGLRSSIKKLEDICMDGCIHEGDIEELNDRIIKLERNKERFILHISTYIKDIKDKYLKENAKYIELSNKINKLDKHIKLVRKGICPTCGSKINKSILNEMIIDHKSCVEQYYSLSSIVLKLQNKIDNSNRYKDDVIYNIDRVINDFNKKIIEIKNIKNINKNFNDSINDINKQIEEEEINLSKVNYSIEEWNKMIYFFEDTIRNKIISGIVPSLNKSIMEYSIKLQQPYIIKFNNEFKCSINIPGNLREVSVSNLSTGQLKTVNMVIILSFLKVIISNSKCNILFLDELLSNSDSNLRDNICELLRENIKEGDSVFIISHSPLSTKYLDGRIEVENIDVESRYSLVGFRSK